MEDLALLPEKDFSACCTNLHKKSNLLFAIGTYKPSIKIFNLTLQSLLLNRNLLDYPLKIISFDSVNKYFILTKNCLEVHSKHGLVKNIKMAFFCRSMVLFDKCVLVIGNKPFIKIIDKKNKMKENFELKIIPCFISTFGEYFSVCDEENVYVYKNYELIFEKKLENEITSLLMVKDFLYIGNQNGELLKINLSNQEMVVLLKESNDCITLLKEDNGFLFVVNDKKIIIFKGNVVKEIEVDCKINSLEVDCSILFLGTDSGEIKIYNVKELGDSPEWCKHLLNE
ncbi:hypothetical protein TUBRATIS_005790 [Tubulinosema ratisbonensis]|uniref:Uncharacterized protein n=1 Tax=Tubulinosema ratisbonensis TaxID=291195 RepID=A0A437ANZ8_9MICR|nr:hypothetical protein TUBRATIS_005790 [Tubulinosema ratisbonensis]